MRSVFLLVVISVWFLNKRRVRRRAELVCKVANAASTRGSFLLSRLANYHPERFSAYAFIDHGYAALGQSLTPAVIQHIDSAVQAKLGYSIFGYFLFFDEDDAAKLLNEHVSSFPNSTNSDLLNIDHTAVRIRGIALLRRRRRDQQEIQGRPGRSPRLVDRGQVCGLASLSDIRSKIFQLRCMRCPN